MLVVDPQNSAVSEIVRFSTLHGMHECVSMTIASDEQLWKAIDTAADISLL